MFALIYLFTILIKRPILSNNAFALCVISGISFRSTIDKGIAGVTDAIIVFLILLFFISVLFILSGLKYNIEFDIDRFKEELYALEFDSVDNIYNNKTHKFIAPNGSKVYVKQYTHNKYIEISIINGIRFKKINETRELLLPLIKKHIKKADLTKNSIGFIVIGFVLFGIYFFV